MILGVGAFEQVELDEARHLVARQPDLLEGGFGHFGDAKPVHGNKHRMTSKAWYHHNAFTTGLFGTNFSDTITDARQISTPLVWSSCKRRYQ
jgi:hypothetical protein